MRTELSRNVLMRTVLLAKLGACIAPGVYSLQLNEAHQLHGVPEGVDRTFGPAPPGAPAPAPLTAPTFSPDAIDQDSLDGGRFVDFVLHLR